MHAVRVSQANIAPVTTWVMPALIVRSTNLPGGLRNARYPLVLNVAYYGRNVAFGHNGWDPARADRRSGCP